MKYMPQCLQLLPQLNIVIDFSVESHADLAVVRPEGLMSCRRSINNGKATVTESNAMGYMLVAMNRRSVDDTTGGPACRQVYGKRRLGQKEGQSFIIRAAVLHGPEHFQDKLRGLPGTTC
jgi:hypothetical protein